MKTVFIDKSYDGTLMIDEFVNDHVAIDEVLRGNNETLQRLYDEVVLDYTDEKWNAYIEACLETLTQAGWRIETV